MLETFQMMATYSSPERDRLDLFTNFLKFFALKKRKSSFFANIYSRAIYILKEKRIFYVQKSKRNKYTNYSK